MNTPTKLTFLRIILTLAVIALLLFPFHAVGIHFKQFDIDGVNGPIRLEVLIAGVIFIIASLTDFLDGYLARKNNQVTDLGKMLDAIADKVLVNPILIVLAAQHFIPVIIPVIYVTRDIVVDAIKMQAATKGKVQAAIKSGKYKTACMMVGICLVFFYNIPFEFINIRVDLGLLIIACILAVVSAIEYYHINKSLIFGDEK